MSLTASTVTVAKQRMTHSYHSRGPLPMGNICGVSRDDGFTDFSLDDVAVKKAALGSARRCVVACDSSKLGRVGFARIGPLDVAATIVTDTPSDEDRAWLTEAGLDVAAA